MDEGSYRYVLSGSLLGIELNNLRSEPVGYMDVKEMYPLDLEDIFKLIPSELNAKNKRFILKNLNEKARFATYENSFLWLRDAGVALPTYNVEEPKLPLLLAKTKNLLPQARHS